MRFGKFTADKDKRFITGDLPDGKTLYIDTYNLASEERATAEFEIVGGAPGMEPQDISDFSKAVDHVRSMWKR